jgi:hypothetical protein
LLIILIIFAIYIFIGFTIVKRADVLSDIKREIFVTKLRFAIEGESVSVRRILAFKAIVLLSSIILWPIFIPSWFGGKKREVETYEDIKFRSASLSNLKEKVSIEQAEREHLLNGIPFGYINRQWEELKAKMIEGDELWYFETSELSWKHLAGRAGYCILRGGKIIDGIITRMN